LKRYFCHRYRWSHDKRRKKLFRARKDGQAKIIRTQKDGWLFEVTDEFKKQI
jgi:hypothetical protein